MNGVAAGPSAPGGGRWRRAELEEQGALEESRALEELGAEALGALEEVGAAAHLEVGLACDLSHAGCLAVANG